MNIKKLPLASFNFPKRFQVQTPSLKDRIRHQKQEVKRIEYQKIKHIRKNTKSFFENK